VCKECGTELPDIETAENGNFLRGQLGVINIFIGNAGFIDRRSFLFTFPLFISPALFAARCPLFAARTHN
jgi:hypothetical protein